MAVSPSWSLRERVRIFNYLPIGRPRLGLSPYLLINPVHLPHAVYS